MSDTVFILGAGASKQAGVPLMGNFLDVAHELWKLEKVDDCKKDFEIVYQGINASRSKGSSSSSLWLAFTIMDPFRARPRLCKLNEL